MQVYIALGSNLGNKRRNLVTAAALLAERAGEVGAISSFYETEPWGFESEHSFLNAALMLETTLAPLDLLRLTQEVERELGRTAKTDSVYHDRLIDIDLLLYGEEVIDQPGLQIPHPLMHRRAFVMTPMAEIAPEVVHPVLGKTMKALSDLLESENAG